MFYVYAYLNPVKPGRYHYKSISFLYEPFYIGKGQNNRSNQILAHNRHCQNKVKKILRANLNPLILFLKSDILEQEAFDFEKQMIKEVGRKDLKRGPLTNLTDGGEGTSNPSEETRRKKSEKLKGKPRPKEVCEKISQSNRGRLSPRKGIKCSEETKRRISEAKKGEKNPMFGKHPVNFGISLSDEIKQKLSKALKGRISPNKGKVFSEEHRKKLSEARIGKLLSEETKRKMATSQKGRTHSEKSKRKMRESRLAVINRKRQEGIKMYRHLKIVKILSIKYYTKVPIDTFKRWSLPASDLLMRQGDLYRLTYISIKEQGLLDPVLCYDLVNVDLNKPPIYHKTRKMWGLYLIRGNIRWLCCKDLGITHMNAIVAQMDHGQKNANFTGTKILCESCVELKTPEDINKLFVGYNPQAEIGKNYINLKVPQLTSVEAFGVSAESLKDFTDTLSLKNYVKE
jgi:hypothetical protein